MVTEATGTTQESIRWTIDLAWFKESDRSFLELAQRSICGKCSEKLGKRKKKIVEADVFTTVQSCCNQDPQFITIHTPILESVFRLLLAAPKQTLTTAEIAQQLSERRGDRPVEAERLNRILDGDRWYGLTKIA